MSIEEFVMWCIENDCMCVINPGDHMKNCCGHRRIFKEIREGNVCCVERR